MSVHYSDQTITVFSLKGKIYCLLWVPEGGGTGGVVSTKLLEVLFNVGHVQMTHIGVTWDNMHPCSFLDNNSYICT